MVLVKIIVMETLINYLLSELSFFDRILLTTNEYNKVQRNTCEIYHYYVTQINLFEYNTKCPLRPLSHLLI